MEKVSKWWQIQYHQSQNFTIYNDAKFLSKTKWCWCKCHQKGGENLSHLMNGGAAKCTANWINIIGVQRVWSSWRCILALHLMLVLSFHRPFGWRLCHHCIDHEMMIPMALNSSPYDRLCRGHRRGRCCRHGVADDFT